MSILDTAAQMVVKFVQDYTIPFYIAGLVLTAFLHTFYVVFAHYNAVLNSINALYRMLKEYEGDQEEKLKIRRRIFKEWLWFIFERTGLELLNIVITPFIWPFKLVRYVYDCETLLKVIIDIETKSSRVLTTFGRLMQYGLSQEDIENEKNSSDTETNNQEKDDSQKDN